MGGIQPQFGALFGPTKIICAGENLFAWDSALLRLSPIRFVRQVEGECSAMWNVRKLQVQIRAIVWRCSPEFLFSSSQPHHVAAATAMKNSVGDSRISARVGDAPAPPAPERTHMSSPFPIISIFSLQARNSVPMPRATANAWKKSVDIAVRGAHCPPSYPAHR